MSIVSPDSSDNPDWAAATAAVKDDKALCTQAVDVPAAYTAFASMGLPYGDAFRLMQASHTSPDGSIAVMTLGRSAGQALHPGSAGTHSDRVYMRPGAAPVTDICWTRCAAKQLEVSYGLLADDPARLYRSCTSRKALLAL